MAVIHKDPAGWLLDHMSFINKSTLHCEDSGSYAFRREYFSMVKPHIAPGSSSTSSGSNMNVFSADESFEITSVGGEVGDKPNKLGNEGNTSYHNPKRKRKYRELNQGEVDSLAYHTKIRGLILEGTRRLLQSGIAEGFLPRAKTGDDSSSTANVGAGNSRLADLCELAKQVPLAEENEEPAVQVINEETPSVPEYDLFSHVTENAAAYTRILTLMGEKYLIPPHASFLLSDVNRMQPLLSYKKYDVIVLDPPWENKSVKRSSRYSYLPSWQIKQMPVPALAAPGCLVVTWVTNRQKHLRFVKEELYPHWTMEAIAEWYWVKITRSFEFVYPLDSPHKKPYEILVLGKMKDSTNCQNREETAPIPDHQLLVSVPSKLHSHKPPLAEVLSEYVRSNAQCLELFARSLQPGWTSWGNEVLRFQHLDYFCSPVDER